MSESQFAHLRVHSEYSLVDGIVRIKPLIEKVATLGMSAVAVTDINNLYALVKFYRAATAQGIKPIFGSDLQLANPDDYKQPFATTLLCQDEAGYHRLSCLISDMYVSGQHLGEPRLDQAILLNGDTKGLIALSGGMKGAIGQAIVQGNDDKAAALLKMYMEAFPNRFYLEVYRVGHEGEGHYNDKIFSLAEQYQCPVVATNDVCFLEESDFEAHEARVCIAESYVLNDPRRPKAHTGSQYLKSPEAMSVLFSDVPQVLENAAHIVKRCNFVPSLGKTFLPQYPIPEGSTIESYLVQKSEEGLEDRLAMLLDQSASDYQEKRAAYEERLKIELDVINAMGFPGYFLIVADFIQWSKDHAIPVGPGRGSGAGSLVAYALKITDLDPLEYDLLFERFLNPERVSMPDFDIDFCMEGRDRVIEYVTDTYGKESVSQIITFGTMAAKAVVRDVGRVLGHPYGFVDKISKMIPFEIGMTLDKALTQEDALRDAYRQDEEVKILIDLAKKLEGITRNVGKHAGGVVIAPSELTDFLPLYCEDAGGQLVTQFDKDDVESIGLVKFDFLGLRTLTIIDHAVQTINRGRAANDEPLLNIDLLPVEDDLTYRLLKSYQTTAIFQLESRGMKDLIKRLQPDTFEDIVALVALFRPGPLQSGMVDDFINRKHGRAKVEYPHPSLEHILKPTYGVILYQEQVMQIAQELAGYTLGGADLLRRAMGKKKPEEMQKQRVIFTEGAVKNGVEESIATYIFDLMEKFAGYGFNKSHSAAYALVSYHTAWLKAHYPPEFMAAVLSADMDNTDKVVILVEECKRMRLKLLPPSVQQSSYEFTVNADREIVYGLGAIKGVGEGAIESMIEARKQGGPFKDLFDLCCRIDMKKANKRVFEALIRSGALDGLGPNRATLMASLPAAFQLASQQLQNATVGQVDLFDVLSSSAESDDQHWAQQPPWDDMARLIAEKETLGFYLTGHPLDIYQAEIKPLVNATIRTLRPKKGAAVKIAGQITGVRTMLNKKQERMAFVTLSDKQSKIEIALFADKYEQFRDVLLKDALVIVTGEVTVDNFTQANRMSAQDIIPLEKAAQNAISAIKIVLQHTNDVAQQIQDLQVLLIAHKGEDCAVIIEYETAQARAECHLGDEWCVVPSDKCLNDLREYLGDVKAVEVIV